MTRPLAILRAMSDDTAPPAERVQELRQRIHDANHAYFVEDAPTLTDAEYDALVRELRQLESEHPDLVTPDSPTQRVGAQPAGELRTLTHGVPMYSLDNAFEETDLDAFAERASRILGSDASLAYHAELKIDGLSVNLRYENGTLVWAATRGNGREGEEITPNVLAIPGLPHSLEDAPTELEVRGEVYLPKAEFVRINEAREEAGEPPFRNPRNAAAGTVRQLDPEVARSRNLEAFFYGVGRTEGLPVSNQYDLLTWLAGHGFRVNETRARVTGMEEARRHGKQSRTAAGGISKRIQQLCGGDGLLIADMKSLVAGARVDQHMTDKIHQVAPPDKAAVIVCDSGQRQCPACIGPVQQSAKVARCARPMHKRGANDGDGHLVICQCPEGLLSLRLGAGIRLGGGKRCRFSKRGLTGLAQHPNRTHKNKMLHSGLTRLSGKLAGSFSINCPQ